MRSRTSARASLLFLTLIVTGLVSACGGGSANQADAPPPAPSPSWEITAKDVKFDLKALTVPADATVSLRFINEEVGILHNVAVYRDSSVKEKIFVGELIAGKKTIDYSFKAPSDGTYFFRCDTHPDMNGPFYVEGPVAQMSGSPF